MVEPHPHVDGTYKLSTERPAGGQHLYVRHQLGVGALGAQHSVSADAVDSPWRYTDGAEVQRAMLVYAHPDDELLFAGGLMLAHPGWEWTLVRAVHGGNDRAMQHGDSVDGLVRHGVNIQNTDCFLMADEWLTAADRVRWADQLQGVADHVKPDVVFTHGARGEYGHPHHIALNNIVHVRCDNVWDFYHPSGLDHEPQLLKGRVHAVPTDARKFALMQEAYPDMITAIGRAMPELIEAQLTGRPEYFTR